MKRAAFVIQRFGKEVNGGSEFHCLKVAQRMSKHWDVEVLTTCALDYMTWENHYRVGAENLDGVTVRRFAVAAARNPAAFNRMSDRIRPRMFEVSLREQEAWMRSQGPWCPQLFKYLKKHKSDYDVFIFFTYLYATTYFGLPIVKDKAYLVPTAHDEWPIYMSMYQTVFEAPRGFIFNTPEERDFLKRRFPAARLEGPVVGVAVDAPSDVSGKRFREMRNIDEPFLLYIGRVDPSKGCGELFDHFARLRAADRYRGKLVLLGKPVMEVPDHPDIVSLGFVDEATKWDALAACDLLVMPSKYESLSIVLLEAWCMGKAVLVNGACDTLVGQCRRAHGGLWYTNYDEFEVGLPLLKGEHGVALGRQGQEYVRKHYSWERIEQEYLTVCE